MFTTCGLQNDNFDCLFRVNCDSSSSWAYWNVNEFPILNSDESYTRNLGFWFCCLKLIKAVCHFYAVFFGIFVDFQSWGKIKVLWNKEMNTNHLELMYLKPNSIKLTPAIPENLILCMRYVTNSIVWELKLYKKSRFLKFLNNTIAFLKALFSMTVFAEKWHLKNELVELDKRE